MTTWDEGQSKLMSTHLATGRRGWGMGALCVLNPEATGLGHQGGWTLGRMACGVVYGGQRRHPGEALVLLPREV